MDIWSRIQYWDVKVYTVCYHYSVSLSSVTRMAQHLWANGRTASSCTIYMYFWCSCSNTGSAVALYCTAITNSYLEFSYMWTDRHTGRETGKQAGRRADRRNIDIQKRFSSCFPLRNYPLSSVNTISHITITTVTATT